LFPSQALSFLFLPIDQFVLFKADPFHFWRLVALVPQKCPLETPFLPHLRKHFVRSLPAGLRNLGFLFPGGLNRGRFAMPFYLIFLLAPLCLLSGTTNSHPLEAVSYFPFKPPLLACFNILSFGNWPFFFCGIWLCGNCFAPIHPPVSPLVFPFSFVWPGNQNPSDRPSVCVAFFLWGGGLLPLRVFFPQVRDWLLVEAKRLSSPPYIRPPLFPSVSKSLWFYRVAPPATPFSTFLLVGCLPLVCTSSISLLVYFLAPTNLPSSRIAHFSSLFKSVWNFNQVTAFGLFPLFTMTPPAPPAPSV